MSVDRYASYKQDGYARQTRGFIQVRPPRRCNTYVLRLIILLYVNEMIFRGVPCPPYIAWGTGLQIWKLILASYNCHRWPDKDSYSNPTRILLDLQVCLDSLRGTPSRSIGPRVVSCWARLPSPSRPKHSRKGIGVNTPTASPRAPCILT